jgi:hypothetical protein
VGTCPIVQQSETKASCEQLDKRLELETSITHSSTCKGWVVLQSTGSSPTQPAFTTPSPQGAVQGPGQLLRQITWAVCQRLAPHSMMQGRLARAVWHHATIARCLGGATAAHHAQKPGHGLACIHIHMMRIHNATLDSHATKCNSGTRTSPALHTANHAKHTTETGPGKVTNKPVAVLTITVTELSAGRHTRQRDVSSACGQAAVRNTVAAYTPQPTHPVLLSKLLCSFLIVLDIRSRACASPREGCDVFHAWCRLCMPHWSHNAGLCCKPPPTN